jgi:hypothetical protein
MPAEIFGGISALKTALDIARGLKDINDAVARNQAVIDLQQTILDAQRGQLELLNEVSELKAKIKATDDKRTELARYEMVDVKNSGEFAYRLRAHESDGNPERFVCPTCFEHGRISTLHAQGSSNGQDWYTCRACDKNISFGRYISSHRPNDEHDAYY